MLFSNSILDLIGQTPLIRINHLNCEPSNLVLAKVESFNPGGSIKDRIGRHMLDRAEQQGKLKPGAVVIEATGAGNTGLGITIAAKVKGYHAIITTPDKNSPEIINMMRAYGAEVVICPTNVDHDDPKSYHSVAARLNKEFRGSFYVNQYDNPANPETHELFTGPEIWEQTDGKIDVLVVGPGTGGTITGLSRYLKKQKPAIRIIGPDPMDSVFKAFLEKNKIEAPSTDISKIDGIGQSFIPNIASLQKVDELFPVKDKETMLMTRRLALQEQLFVGMSSGAAMVAYDKYCLKYHPHNQTIVLIFPDSGNRYLSKVFDDEWMKKNGFM